jgi:hypothetical protein
MYGGSSLKTHTCTLAYNKETNCKKWWPETGIVSRNQFSQEGNALNQESAKGLLAEINKQRGTL